MEKWNVYGEESQLLICLLFKVTYKIDITKYIITTVTLNAQWEEWPDETINKGSTRPNITILSVLTVDCQYSSTPPEQMSIRFVQNTSILISSCEAASLFVMTQQSESSSHVSNEVTLYSCPSSFLLVIFFWGGGFESSIVPDTQPAGKKSHW